jgi:phosphatidylserine/phosphatidylglycerophosphate/cardiolipin synthase-like enzyme
MKREHWIQMLFATLAVAGIALFLVRSLSGRDQGVEPENETGPFPRGEAGSTDRWYRVYFTVPVGEEGRNFRGGPDAALCDAIRQARLSVDLAVYELDLWSVRDALKEIQHNGVIVRVVTDSDQLADPEIQALLEAGIPVSGDNRESLMHDKFAVIDRREVWTGSMNLTVSSAYLSNNNLLRVISPELAENYRVEFEEMFAGDQFGAGSPANTPYPLVSVGATRIETYFSPEDGTAERLLALIRSAQKSIYFLAYSFTSDEIGAALLERAQAGVDVAGVLDESQALTNSGAEYERLRAQGLEVYLDGNPEDMHHKVILVDEKIVVTGSYNFSASAEERNDENTLILHDPEIAGLYRLEFEKIMAEAKR